ncbi:hypothetical protein SNE40_008447 [Patella caerulea]|uniref:PPM-type phosphatase domain-containing protein n=1 Tax=Patella caerulea TaxID=87958 RepID=A0AAN8JYV8_PATCE
MLKCVRHYISKKHKGQVDILTEWIKTRSRTVRYFSVGSHSNERSNPSIFTVGSRHYKGLDDSQSPRLTPHQVTTILRLNETSIEENNGAIRGFETNQLRSNNPIEDRRGEAKLPHGNKYLFGVYDGHAGCACAQALNERLFNYLAVALSPSEVVERVKNGEIDLDKELLHWYHGGVEYRHSELRELYAKSLRKFARENLTNFSDDQYVPDILMQAFLRLDEDIGSEALPVTTNTVLNGNTSSVLNTELLTIAFAGAVACVAYIDGTDMFVANVGDCRAVLGVNKGADNWEAKELTQQHDANNESEVNRILKQHPNESNNVIKNGRLFGDLAPFRAFGDVRYKWHAKDLKHIMNTNRFPHSFISVYGDKLLPNNYNTPPYLIAEPEIKYHQLSPKDKFLVLASDGLWDMISPEKVIQLVAGHMDGRQVLVNFDLPRENMTLGAINQLLTQRKKSFANKTVDSNVATHLIRNAIGQDHLQLSAQLTLPNSISRFYRDDITVTVVFFDSDYIMDNVT